MIKNISNYNIEDIKEQDTFSFEEKITETMLKDFAMLSGDYSTLHMDESFAKQRGFNGKVVHGFLLMSFLSRLVGMHFPGENAMLMSVSSKFLSPAYVGDRVRINAKVDQVSIATGTVVLKTTMENMSSSKLLVRSKIMVGFTNIKA